MDPKTYLKDDARQADNYIFDSAKLEELQRLDEQSECLNILMHNKPIHAQLTQQPQKILEIGCGTGLMTCLLARRYPQAKVYGIDPTPIPLSFHNKPDNVEYVQGKFQELLESGDRRLELGCFDFVFSRMMLLVISDWPLYIHRIQSLLKPGGWMELQEVSTYTHYSGSSPTPDQPIDGDWQWASAIKDGCMVRGIECAAGSKMASRMSSAGLSDVEVVEYPSPLTTWPGRPESEPMLKYNMKYIPTVTPALLQRFAGSSHSGGKITAFQEDATKVYSAKIDRLHWKFYACAGRKPV